MIRRRAALRTPPPNCARQKSGSATARRRRSRPDSCVDADLIGVGARHVKGVNAAMAAEGVLGGPRVELVGRELALAAQQLETSKRFADALFVPK